MPLAASRSCPCTTPSPTAATSSRFPVTNRLRQGLAARVGIRAAASLASTPWAAWSPTASNDATCNRARILAWWTRHPQANIGLAIGHTFGVLDIDGPDGEQAVRELAATHGLQSAGPLVRTGGGAPAGTQGALGAGQAGVDRRVQGGVIVWARKARRATARSSSTSARAKLIARSVRRSMRMWLRR
jgi:hypothetical protein